MSIQSEITRIAGNVTAALTAIGNKGVTVPSGSDSDDLATLIASIPTLTMGTTTATVGSSDVTSLAFSNVTANPKYFVCVPQTSMTAQSTSYRYITHMIYTGSSVSGSVCFPNSSSRCYNYYYAGRYSKSYSSSTHKLTLSDSSSPSSNRHRFLADITYLLIFFY